MRARAWIAGEPVLLALVAATAAIDSAAALIRHARVESGLDLAIFDQAVWHYSRLEAPFSSIEAKNLLGDHLHPLLVCLAPLYWVWSDPRMLLIAQSVLVAASIVVVFAFARPYLARTGAYLLAGAYASFWGLQVGVLYEFHELAFAPLLIALAILMADRRRWGWFWLAIVLLLGVKEDLSVLVAFFGIYLLSRGEVRHGVALVVAGVAWYELATGVFIPYFAAGTPYAHWTYGDLGRDIGDAGGALARAPWRVFTIGFSSAEKVHTMAALLAPFLLLSLGSRLFILAVPLLAERFLSTNPLVWTSHYHYSLAIAPVLAMGAARGLSNLARLFPQRRCARIVVLATGLMLVASLAATRLGASDSALSQITRPSFYRAPSYAAGLLRALRLVPPDASLATDDFVLPHASQRRRVELVAAAAIGRDQYVLVNLLDPDCCGHTGNPSRAAFGLALEAELATTTPTYYDAGWLLARLPPPGARPANGVLRPMSSATAHTLLGLAGRWRGELAAPAGLLAACRRRSTRPAARARPCSALEGAGLPSLAVSLATALGAARPALRGGCGELATAALLATRKLADDQRRLGGAGRIGGAVRAPDRSTLAAAAAAAAAAQMDAANHDLTEQLDRLVILCTPRTPGPRPPSPRAAPAIPRGRLNNHPPAGLGFRERRAG